jgi:HAMP domain-containing protein
MKRIIPGEIHLVVAERHDQVTGLFWTRNPEQRLANLASTVDLGRTSIRPTQHAVRILKSLAQRLPDIGIRDEDAIWTSSDFEEVLAALAEFDLATGKMIERAGLRANDPVYIPALGRGVVTGFTGCGRVIVELDRGNRLAKSVAIASRASVKPILRAVRP